MFNAAATVGATLASVRSLEGVNWHCIVIDDGSTDGNASAQIVRAVQQVDPRFTLLSKTNGGLSSARNAGLDYLRDHPTQRGEYILLLDADDELIASGIRELLRQAQGHTGHNTSLAGNFEIINATGLPLRSQTIPIAHIGLGQLLDLPMLVPNCLLHRWQDIAGHRFTNSRRKIEDYDLYFRMALAGVTWTAIDAPIARYRISANSMSHDFAACLRDGQAVIAEAFAAARAASIASELRVDTSAQRERAVLGKQALNWSTREAVCTGRVAEAVALLQTASGTVPTGEDFLAGCIDSAVMLGLGIAPEAGPNEATGATLSGIWRNVQHWCTALEQLGHFAPALAARLPPLLDLCAQDKPRLVAELLAAVRSRVGGPEGLTSLTVFGYGTVGREFVKQAQHNAGQGGGGKIFVRDTRLDPTHPSHQSLVPPGTILQAWDAPVDNQTLCIVTIGADGAFLTRPPLIAVERSRMLRWADTGTRQHGLATPWADAAKAMATTPFDHNLGPNNIFDCTAGESSRLRSQ